LRVGLSIAYLSLLIRLSVAASSCSHYKVYFIN
jgi:hypothetical protein